MNDNDHNIKKQIAAMSVREKAGQCIMIEPVFCLESENKKRPQDPYHSILDPRFLDLLFGKYHVGCLLFGGITRLGDDQLIDWARHFETINQHVNRLGHIPLLFGVDAVHGVNFVKNTTIFPHNLGVAATWNPDLTREYMKVVGEELSTIGINLNFAPTIDLARDQRWGRVYESLGEDPYLASRFSAAMVEGMQANNKVAACAKHFIGYGESNNGMDRTPADLSDRVLKELHQPPYQAAIDSGVKGIMVHGSDLNGLPMPANKRQMITVLRDEMGFKGVTMSDWEDVARLVDLHRVAKDYTDAIIKSFNAGLDLSMAVDRLDTVDIIERLVASGDIPMARLNQAVERILRLKYELGLFERNPIPETNVVSRPFQETSKQIARQVVEQSLTLLKNDHNLLPLDPNISSILVTGRTANSKRHMCGGWTLNWASAHEHDLEFHTILDAIKQSVSDRTEVTYVASMNDWNHPDIQSKSYDVILSVVGEEPHSEWLGDSFSMTLETEEQELLQAVHQNDVPMVVIAMVGRPQQITWLDDHVSSILWAYLPGSEGAQPIVDTVFGKVNPSGVTPITFPKDANQIPIVYNARKYHNSGMNTGYDPLYPFGYGLSYTTFAYKHLVVPATAPLGTDIPVSITIQNTGSMAGRHVVLLYLEDLTASVTRPRKALKGFTQVVLHPQEEQVVTFLLTPKELGLYDASLQWTEEARTIRVMVGEWSQLIALQ